MNRIRYLAASLLCLAGFMHVVRIGLANAPVAIVVGFGVVYLIIGGLLFRNCKSAYFLGAFIPLLGLCVGPLILKDPPVLIAAFLGVVEMVAVVCCFFLIKNSRSTK